MLYLSTLLIEHKDVETFDEFLEVIRQKAVEVKCSLGLI